MFVVKMGTSATGATFSNRAEHGKWWTFDFKMLVSVKGSVL